MFARARAASPCVLFFDELDSLAPARGVGADSGGVMDRVVAQLLAEIDAAQSGNAGGASESVFVVGATNRPDLLDPALMRPGRLDSLLYVGIASDVPSRFKVLQALTRGFAMDEDVDLRDIAGRCSQRTTGADLYALCADAWMAALKRTIELGRDGVEVCQSDFLVAVRDLTPSVSEEELARYEALRGQYQSRAA